METKKCKSCEKKFTPTQVGMMAMSVYILISSIYGTYQLIKLFF